MNTQVVIESGSGQRRYSWDMPPDAGDFHWAPDGQAVDYVITRGALSNLWRQSHRASLGRLFALSAAIALNIRLRACRTVAPPFDKIACKVKSWLSQLYVNRLHRRLRSL